MKRTSPMAASMNNFSVLLFITTILCLFSPSLQQQGGPTGLSTTNTKAVGVPKRVKKYPPGGLWEMLNPNIRVSAMHMQLLHDNTVVVFDRTDVGISNLTLPNGKCRPLTDVNEKVIPGQWDCGAHSILYDLRTNTYRPLYVETDVWCSSGIVAADGTLIQTGGYDKGEKTIRLFKTCHRNVNCDWEELKIKLHDRRWYATNQILPDGRAIIVGGERAPTYEFYPQDIKEPASQRKWEFPLLKETTDFPEPNNLYPAVHLLPDGNLFILANRRSVLLDYHHDRVIKEYPMIPGEIRTYPCTGTSAMLPLKLNKDQTIQPEVEVMVCGGTTRDVNLRSKDGIFLDASKNCGRLKVTDPNPQWFMEDMPMPRTMPDMINLPDGTIFIVNGAKRGSGGWEMGEDPAYEPLLYKPYEKDLTKRFVVLNPSKIPRLYHSTALLLPDARVLISGSNPHKRNIFQGTKYPTDMTMETFSPDYLLRKGHWKPSIKKVSAKDNFIKYGQRFEINIKLNVYRSDNFEVVLAYPSFTTHSVQMNQRLISLPVEGVKPAGPRTFEVIVDAPLSPNIAPPGYYMLFVVNGGIPSKSVWVNINK